MSSKLKVEVQPPIDILRALLNIQKCPITLSVLLKEYREIEGKSLPFKSFGFKSAEEYLKSSGEFLIINDRGEVYISARPNKDSVHIVDMIAHQKAAKKRSRRSFGNSSNRIPAKTDQSWNKSSYSSNVYRNLPSAKSSSDVRNKRRGNDKVKRNSSVNQRNGDSNNNTNYSNNRNIAEDTLSSTKAIKQISNGQSTLHLQPLMANLVPKPDLRDRINFSKQQMNQGQQKLQKSQQSTKEKQQVQKQNHQNNCNNKHTDVNQKELQIRNGETSQNKNEKQQQQKQSGAQSKSSSNLASLQNRLENVRNAKKLNLNDETDINLKTANNELNKNIQTPISATRIFSTSIQDRLKINKSNSINETHFEPITPPSSPFAEYSAEKLNSSFNSSRQSSQDSLQNYAYLTNVGKSAVINNKQINKTKKILLPTEHYEFDSNLNSIVSLMNYCSARGFPTPKFNLMQPKFFNKKVLCSVIINEKTYTTIPKYFNDPEIAKAACAAIAIEEIKLMESKIISYPICTDSNSDLILKIYQEIKTNHTLNGIFLNGLPKLFESKFQQTLPDHWSSLIENSKFFVIESTSDNNKILLANMSISDLDVLPSDQDDFIIDPLELPWDSKYWNLYITHCASTIEVWARIVDKEYSQQLDSLLNDVDLEMLTDKIRPGSLTTGQMYLVCISECWHRVRLERMDKAVGKCLCFFIDFGDDDWLPMDQLFVCDKKFLKLPPQAVPFSLFGLEDFAENPVANQHLNEMIMGKTLIAQIFTKKETYEAKNSSSSSISSSLDSLNDIIKIQAVLYDTSSNVDVVLNPLLINKICDDTLAPELKQNSPTNVNVTHITDEGDIYLQVLDSGLFYVQKLITQLVESKFQQDQYKINSNEIKPSNLYLIYDQDDKKWYRGCLIDNCEKISPAQEFKFFYVDYGITKQILISNIFRLESLSAALSRYPKQALKAKMHNLPPLNEFLLQRLKALLPKDSLAIVKLAFNKLDASRNVVPHITVFIRIERNQSLCNVNDAIRMEYELISNDFPAEIFKITTNNEANSSSSSSPTSLQPKIISELSPCIRNYSVRSPITVPSTPVTGSLPKLNTDVYFPKKGEIFNVLVTIASNPFNFFVRPYNDFLQYQNMMTELQTYCQENDEFIPDDMVKAGESYAVLLDDGFYYRCIIEIALPNQMCIVFFCDCGDRNVVEINALRTLPAKCRELPTQAIQAKLHGIKPLTGEWTLEDSIRFSELTVGQKFASVVQNISIDDFDPNKTSKVLELTLIDVVTLQDIYVHDILIEENRATLIT